ncbi:uncharacterized protein LOC142173485 [Nicotiana tabacum]|uniref:Uncharacterized protein LOC142173485 n=1 Tax=Nicotiana tabacum TaxID=4097 RepID=A0AC58TD72_TOBAC
MVSKMGLSIVLKTEATYQEALASATPSGGGNYQVSLGIDYSHPLFLHLSDVSGIQIISFQLTGRNKLGLVDGSSKNEDFPKAMKNHWERVNAIVVSWIKSSVAKGLLGGIMYATNAKTVLEEFYFSKLKDLWEEFEALVPAPSCNCEKSKEFRLHLQKLKLFQFLMRLNDSYAQARSQILLMSPMSYVNQAYSMVISDESQNQSKI